MRSSAVVALALLAVAAPTFAAPVASPHSAPFARRGAAPTTVPTSSLNQTFDESGAIKLGTVATIASAALPFVGSIISHLTNHGQEQQARELEELVRRAEVEEQESGAISLGTVAKVGSFVIPVLGSLISHFTGGDKDQQQQQQREFVEKFARDIQAQDGSEALSFSDIKNIGSMVFHAGSALKDVISGYVLDFFFTT